MASDNSGIDQRIFTFCFLPESGVGCAESTGQKLEDSL